MNTAVNRDRGSSIRHDGPCGRRTQCWRPECRERFGTYATLEVLPSGALIAFCHRAAFDIKGSVLR